MHPTPVSGLLGRTCGAETPGVGLRRRYARLLPAVAALLVCATPATADVPGILGGGNIEGGRDLDRAEAKLQALRAAGLGMCRLPVSANAYDVQGTPRPERLDRLVLLVHAQGLRPIFLFEYYTRWNGELGGREKWVWQNRKAWTDQPGTIRRLDGLPPKARKLEVYAWDGLFQTVPLSGQNTITIDGLREDETWMFVATAEQLVHTILGNQCRDTESRACCRLTLRCTVAGS